ARPLRDVCAASAPRVYPGMTKRAAKAYVEANGSRLRWRTLERRVASMPKVRTADERTVVFPHGLTSDLASDPDFRLPALGDRKAREDNLILLDVGPWIYCLAVVGRKRPPTTDHFPFRRGAGFRERIAGREKRPGWYRLV